MRIGVEIPGGQASFRERGELRGKDQDLLEAAGMAAASALAKMPEDLPRKPEESDEEYRLRAMELLKDVALTMDENLAMLQFRRAAVLATLTSWTLEIPLPKTMEDLGELPGDLYRGLIEAASLGPGTLEPVDFSPSDPRSPEFERSPTSPSSSSASRSEGAEGGSTRSRRDGSKAIAIADSSPL